MHGKLARAYSVIVALALLFSLIAIPATRAVAVSPDVVISQVYGGGGNNGGIYTNDFIELFNRGTSAVSLTGWSVQYTSATGTGNFGSTTNLITPLSGSLGAGQYLLIQEAAGTTIAPLPTPDLIDASPINMGGTGGKVALVTSAAGLGCNGGSAPCSPAQLALIKDLVGWGSANFYETAPAPATVNQTAVLRGLNGCQDTDNNGADFTSTTPTPRNTASPITVCGAPSGVGAAQPNPVLPRDSTLLTVVVTPGTDPTSTGLAVSCNLSSIGGSSTQSLLDDGTNGDATAGDNTFSYVATVDPSTSGGAKTLGCTITEAEGRTGNTSITLTVTEILPIGAVNGPVADGENATAHRSPFAPASGNNAGSTIVAVQGVIYEKTLQAIGGSTDSYRGFFIQDTAATADGDPNTSDGLFVFMSTFDTLIGGYTPQVGDEVVISGKIQEYFNMTEMSSAQLLRVVRSGVDIDAEVAPAVADPPAGLADANRYWERLQGMRIQAPQNSIVLGGRNVFNPADAEVWLARPDSTIAQRADAYTRRAFRDAHPLDDNYDPNVWDGNGYRLLIGSLGIKYAENNAQALIAGARTYSTMTNAPAGGLNYTFNKYRIEISEQPALSVGADPAQNNPPEAFDRDTGYSIVDFNLENLYDYRDNPFSGCDFQNIPAGSNPKCSKTGTPFIADVTPSSGGYDYVPASDAVYQARLTDIATQIINDLHSPDILMVQEVENQDFCAVSGGQLVCGTTDNADGKPDSLQDLALKIASLGGPAYDAAFDRDSSDLRGIAPSFLYRTDRVQLAPVGSDPLLSQAPQIDGYTPVPYDSDVSNPKTLNAVYAGTGACETSWVFPRAPDVALFRIYNQTAGVGGYHEVYVINNHFKSGPDTCVAHRTEQAKFNAALVAYLQQTNPEARVVLGGDLNVYPRPDDPFAPVGEPGSSDQLGALYNNTLGLKNLWEVLLAEHPEAAYSYVYVGMAQTLDQMFVNPLQLATLDQYRIAHINSDFPADFSGDVARGTSDHDPGVALFSMFHATGLFQPIDNPPELNIAKAGTSIPVKFSLDGDQGLNILAAGYPVSVQTACDASEPTDAIEETVNAGSSSLSYDATTDTYSYVWKTQKSWANSCRQLTVKLVDGTTFQANFNFTR
jgi:predicted extracellular nuclease